MKYLKIINIISLLCSTNFLIAQSWQWSNHIGSSQWDFSGNVAVDAIGNSYWAGIFQGGYCYSNIDTLGPIIGNSDFIISKFDPSGNKLWWTQLGGNNTITNCSDGVASMVCDIDGNLYLTGSICGSATFGSTFLTSLGQEDCFIAKFDGLGNCIWAKNVGGVKSDFGSGITLDNDGNLFLCGTNNETATFDTFTIPPGGFIAKYDTSGTCLWAKNKMSYVATQFMGNFCTAAPQSVKYKNGLISISGYISNDTINIDTTTIYTLIPNSNHGYIAQFDTSGNSKWVNIFSGPTAYFPGYEHGVDDDGNNYVTGTFGGQGYFQTDTLQGSLGAFLVKFNENGIEQWVQEVATSGESYGNMTSSDGYGNIYLTGKFSGGATFGSFNLTASSPNDMFVARYNSSGDCLGVRAFGQAEGYGVTQDANGNAYVCGNFDNTITIGNNTYTSYGDKDIFIAKLDEIVGISEERSSSNQLFIYANPNAGKCNITVPDEFVNEKNLTLSIFDNSGKLIQQKTLQMNDGKIKLNLEAEAKGVYNVNLSNGKKVYVGKMVME